MTIALNHIWLLPVAIGVFGVYYFARKDLLSAPSTAHSKAKTEG